MYISLSLYIYIYIYTYIYMHIYIYNTWMIGAAVVLPPGELLRLLHQQAADALADARPHI